MKGARRWNLYVAHRTGVWLELVRGRGMVFRVALDEAARGELAGIKLALAGKVECGACGEGGTWAVRRRGEKVNGGHVVWYDIGELPAAVRTTVRDAHILAWLMHETGNVASRGIEGRDLGGGVVERNECIATEGRDPVLGRDMDRLLATAANEPKCGGNQCDKKENGNGCASGDGG